MKSVTKVDKKERPVSRSTLQKGDIPIAAVFFLKVHQRAFPDNFFVIQVTIPENGKVYLF